MSQKEKAKDSKKPQKFKIKQDDGIVLVGKRGSGKTSAMRFLMKNVLKGYNFAIMDALGNFSDFEGQSGVKYYRVNPSDQGEVDQIIDSVLEEGNEFLVMDEVDRYNSRKGSSLNDAINLGRNFGIGYIMASRRTADIDKAILANATWVIVFQHILPQDLKVLVDWFSLPEEKFRDLQEHEVRIFKDGVEVWQGVFPAEEAPEATLPERPKKGKPKEKEPEEPEGEKEPEVPDEEIEEEIEEEPEEEPIEEPVEEKSEEVKDRCIVCGEDVNQHTDEQLNECLGKMKGHNVTKVEDESEDWWKSCPWCHKPMNTPRDLASHVRQDHPKELKQVESEMFKDEEDVDPNICKDCKERPSRVPYSVCNECFKKRVEHLKKTGVTVMEEGGEIGFTPQNVINYLDKHVGNALVYTEKALVTPHNPKSLKEAHRLLKDAGADIEILKDKAREGELPSMLEEWHGLVLKYIEQVEKAIKEYNEKHIKKAEEDMWITPQDKGDHPYTPLGEPYPGEDLYKGQPETRDTSPRPFDKPRVDLGTRYPYGY